MKPFSSVPKPSRPSTSPPARTPSRSERRTDACAVPAGGVVGEAVVAFELARAVLEKFGGDALPETRRNLEAFVAACRDRLPGRHAGAGKSTVGGARGMFGVPSSISTPR